jgi:hypothetical protein
MTVKQHSARGRPGDWLQAKGLPGCPSRLGQIVEVIRTGGCERYRVRWDETHESICYPADGVAILPRTTVVPEKPVSGAAARPRPGTAPSA